MPPGSARDSRRRGYETARADVQALVPRSARRILDLGCASGALGTELKRRQGASVVGVELDAEYAREAALVLDEVVNADLETAMHRLQGLGPFDCLIAADVLEHLIDPWSTLRQAAGLLTPDGTAVVSVPNVRSLETLVEVGVRGRWPLADEGLFDRTHLRWFTLADALDLVEEAGLAVRRIERNLFYSGWRRQVARTLVRTRLAPFLTGQYLLVATRG